MLQSNTHRPRPLGVAGFLAAVALAAPAIAAVAPPCPGNANGDLIVNFQDLNIVLGQWGQSGALQGDVNADNVVNFADLNIVLGNFNQPCFTATAILPNKTMIPATSNTVNATVTNTAGAQITVYWRIVKESGEPNVTIATAQGSATIAAGVTKTITIGYTVAGNTQAGDDAKMRFSVYSDAARTILVDDDPGWVVVKPTGETTTSNGWGAGNLRTVHKWKQSLTPNAASFKGRSVTERDPGGGGPDTCWWPGSAFAKFTAITGGTWAVGSVADGHLKNEWGDDHVGWFKTAVDYYRAQGRAPCQTQFPQDMHINGAGDPRYHSTVLKMGFSNAAGANTWSERDGVRANTAY